MTIPELNPETEPGDLPQPVLPAVTDHPAGPLDLYPAIDRRAAEAEAAARWNERALACCWPLGRSLDVHFATDMPTRVLVSALQLYLRLEPDELLLAIIDPSRGRDPASGCALTTRRLYWADYTGTCSPAGGQAAGASARPPLRRSIDYADLANVGPDGVVRREGTAHPEGRLAVIARWSNASGPLIDALNALSRAARGEPAPIVPAAAEAARRDLPEFARRADTMRTVQVEVPRDFPSLLKAARPRVVATPTFASVCLVVFAIMVAWGVPPFARDAELGCAWGASFGPSVALDGETWRLLTSMFLHYGLLHLGFNLWFLLKFGPLVERLFGTWGFAALYLLSGLGGSIASLWYHPMVVSAGASGALFGVAGALLGYLVARPDVPPRAILQLFRPSLLIYLGVDSLLGLLVPQIDGAAHVGGLATGFACGLALGRPWPPPPAAYAPRRRLAAAGLLAAGLVVLLVALMPGIRARLKRELVVMAYDDSQEAQQAYKAFVCAIERAANNYEKIGEELDECTSKLDRGTMPVGPAIEALRRMTSRAEADARDLRTVSIKEPELRVALERLASALTHQHRALDALGRYLKSGDRRLLEGAGGYEAHLRSGGEDIRSFNEACARYLKAHGLTSTSP